MRRPANLDLFHLIGCHIEDSDLVPPALGDPQFAIVVEGDVIRAAWHMPAGDLLQAVRFQGADLAGNSVGDIETRTIRREKDVMRTLCRMDFLLDLAIS